MGAYIIIILFIMLGLIVGVSTRFFSNFGENIAKNRMKELGIEEDRMSEDEPDERLR